LKRTLMLLTAGLGLIVAGCGSAADKGKNKDKDVPKAPSENKGVVCESWV
jgi:protein involved in sex pheromone biosynthesis